MNSKFIFPSFGKILNLVIGEKRPVEGTIWQHSFEIFFYKFLFNRMQMTFLSIHSNVCSFSLENFWAEIHQVPQLELKTPDEKSVNSNQNANSLGNKENV